VTGNDEAPVGSPTRFSVRDRVRNRQGHTALVIARTAHGFRYFLDGRWEFGPRHGWADEGESFTDEDWELVHSAQEGPKPVGRVRYWPMGQDDIHWMGESKPAAGTVLYAGPVSPIAARAIPIAPQELLKEYNYPANTDNAARAGWEACRRWLLTFATGKATRPTDKPDESGWLVEYNGKMLNTITGNDVHRESLQYLCVRSDGKGIGGKELSLHSDVNLAVRFARKEDAEAVMQMYAGYTRRDSIVDIGNYLSVSEHIWSDVPVDPPAEEKK
jgi:hypothetical protein